MHFELKKIRPYLSFIFLWLILAVFVNPFGEFPVNDDWAYAHNVKSLVDNNELYFSDWPAMTLFSQTMWGTVIGKLFGFSFASLRIGTLVLSLMTCMSLYYLISKLTQARQLAWLGVAVLCASPFFLSLSFTFMTEIPFLFLLICSAIAMSCYFETPSRRNYLFLLLFIVLAILQRQTALLLPLAFMLVLLLKNKRSFVNILMAVLPVIIGLTSMELYKIWRVSAGFSLGTLSTISDLFRSISDVGPKHYFMRAGLIFMYVGIALLPLSIRGIKVIYHFFSKQALIYFAILLLLIVPCFLVAWNDFPSGNVVYDLGLGPKLLKDTYHHINDSSGYYEGIWLVIKLVGAFSFIVLAFALVIQLKWSKLKRLQQISSFHLMIGLLAIAEFAYLMINPIFFDRYTLVLSFWVMLLIVYQSREIIFRKVEFILPVFLLIVYAIFVRDYMSWNRAKEKAYQFLTVSQSIPSNKIDAGFEYNAWNRNAAITEMSCDKSAKSWWFVDQDDYVISNGDYMGYRKWKGFSIGNILTPGPDSIFILRKSNLAFPSNKVNIDFEHQTDRSRILLTTQGDAFAFIDSPLSNISRSGAYSLELNDKTPFGIGYEISHLKLNEVIRISCWVKGPRGKLIVETKESESVKVGKVLPTKKKGEEWQEIQLEITVDKGLDQKSLTVFYMNDNPKSVYIDDVVITRIQENKHQ